MEVESGLVQNVAEEAMVEVRRRDGTTTASATSAPRQSWLCFTRKDHCSHQWEDADVKNADKNRSLPPKTRKWGSLRPVPYGSGNTCSPILRVASWMSIHMGNLFISNTSCLVPISAQRRCRIACFPANVILLQTPRPQCGKGGQL
jgi:hypothetical protein